MSSLSSQKGVLHGDALQELFEIAKKNQFALPAVNVTGTDVRSWSIESKTSASFVINSNANQTPISVVGWQAQINGEVG